MALPTHGQPSKLLVELGAPWKCKRFCIVSEELKLLLIIVISMVYVLSEVVVSLGKELNVVINELAFSLVLSR